MAISPLKIVVIDTETASLSGDVYDFAYAICNKKGHIFHTRNFVVSEVVTDPSKMMCAFYARKVFSDYIPLMLENPEIVVTWDKVREIFLQDCREYGVNVLAAYNLAFDIRAMKNTHKLLGSGKFLDFSPRLLDIWEFACTSLLKQRNYKKIAEYHGWLTEKGNIKTSAEMAYRYLSGEPDFIENHTALSDVLIEVEILADCYRQKKPIPYGVINGKTWRHIN